MSKREPTEAQRKAMAEATEAWNWYSCGPERRLDMVDDMIAAANSIPEGAPVGTIARRPDGEWIAWRTEDGWGYRFIGDEEPNEWPPGSNIADSWPVIFTPGEAVGSGPTTDGGETYDPTLEKTREEKIQDYMEWSETQIDTDALDPTAQQEPGESLARGLDDIAAGQVSRRDDYLEPQREPCCGVSEVYDCDCPPAIRITPKPCTPRVVDRLGVDEQGSRWRDRDGDEWKYQNGWRWRECPDIWAVGNPSPTYAPYTEILEPRVLPSLDCEEARDGTEWKFRLNGEPRSLVYRNNGWRYGEVGDRIGGRCGVSDGHAFIREFAPYIEVVGDPS